MFSTVLSFSASFTVNLKINTFGHKFLFEPQDTTYRDCTSKYNQYYGKYFQFFVFAIPYIVLNKGQHAVLKFTVSDILAYKYFPFYYV